MAKNYGQGGMPELKPCPFCGGEAEFDGLQGYRNMATGAMETQSVVYCTQCTVTFSQCHCDNRDLPHESINSIVIDGWNRRVAE
jgi:hypothetical protein